jgi:hypothetical protein
LLAKFQSEAIVALSVLVSSMARASAVLPKAPEEERGRPGMAGEEERASPNAGDEERARP